MRCRLNCLISAVLATAIAVNGSSQAQTKTPRKDATPVIVVLGSSTAAGTGANPIDSAWVWRLTEYVKRHSPSATVVNLAVGGYTTYDIMPTDFTPPSGRPTPKEGHNITQALSYNPDELIINLPSNDAASGYSVQEQLENYSMITGKIANPKMLLFVSTPQPRNFADAARLHIQKEMRDSTNRRFRSHTMDFWSGLANTDGSLKKKFDSGDGIHLNNAGHRLLFQRALNAGVWSSLRSANRETRGASDRPRLRSGQER